MKSLNHLSETQQDDPRNWIGGEATVGSQAGRYIRRQAGPSTLPLGVILGLTFFGGLTLGSAFGLLCRKKSK